MSQNYEDYWKLTNAFTNYNGKNILSVIADMYSSNISVAEQ